MDEFIRVYGGFSQLKSKAVSDAIVRDLANTEVARIMKAKSMELCQRQIMKYDRFILRAAFNAFAAITKDTDHEHKRRRVTLVYA